MSPSRAAETAAAAVERVDRRPQIRGRQLGGKVPIDEHQLAVGELPHQRWREAIVRTEDDDQVRLDVGRGVQLPGDRLLVDELARRYRRGGRGERLAAVGRRVDDDGAWTPCHFALPPAAAARRVRSVGSERQPARTRCGGHAAEPLDDVAPLVDSDVVPVLGRSADHHDVLERGPHATILAPDHQFGS